MVVKVLTMTDEKTKKKAIEAAADIFGTNFNPIILNFHAFRLLLPDLLVCD